MNYREYYFAPAKGSALTYRVQLIALNQNDYDTAQQQELAIRATSPLEAFNFSLLIRNEKFDGFNTLIYVKDPVGQVLFNGKSDAGTNVTYETDLPVFQVTIIREAGPDATGSSSFDYAEDH